MRADLPWLMSSNVYPTSSPGTLGVCSATEPNFFAVSVATMLAMLMSGRLLTHLCWMNRILPQPQPQPQPPLTSPLVENMTFDSVPCSPHLLSPLPFRFSPDLQIQTKNILMRDCIAIESFVFGLGFLLFCITRWMVSR